MKLCMFLRKRGEASGVSTWRVDAASERKAAARAVGRGCSRGGKRRRQAGRAALGPRGEAIGRDLSQAPRHEALGYLEGPCSQAHTQNLERAVEESLTPDPPRTETSSGKVRKSVFFFITANKFALSEN
jgi:hypothetical protein